MATIQPTLVETPLDGRMKLWRWELDAGDVGAPALVPHKADKSIQVRLKAATGAFGDSTLLIEGANDPAGASYNTLSTPGPTPAALSGIAAARLSQILEGCYLIRPSLGGTTGVDVIVDLLVLGQ